MNYLYARTSTNHQENGMEDQVAKLSAWAADNGPSELLTEQASARSLSRRPVLVNTLRELDVAGEGKLVVTTLTRLCRSTADFYQMVARSNRRGWDLVVLDMELDTSTATGKLIAGVLVQVGEWESEIHGERIRDAMAIAKAGGAKFGRFSTVPEKTRQLIATLRNIETLSWRAIAARLNEDGVPTPSGTGSWHTTSVQRHYPREDSDA